MARVSVCWSSPRQCDHFLSCVNGAGLPLGQVGETAMFYCNTCGKSPSPFIVILGDLDTPYTRRFSCPSVAFISVLLLSYPTNGMNLLSFVPKVKGRSLYTFSLLELLHYFNLFSKNKKMGLRSWVLEKVLMTIRLYYSSSVRVMTWISYKN